MAKKKNVQLQAAANAPKGPRVPPSDIEEDMWTETDDQSSSKEEMSDFDEEMIKEGQAELALLSKPMQYETIGMGQSPKAWSKIKKNRNLGYNGNGRSMKFRKEKDA
ncbi:hypothetical protein C8R45DRAFT_1110000 [Mycena sanguinolenta]|nr:hypothetical protein C8R45DRAFT_1110000 [Mycena sanguinolenta]